jgi:hypothetical protein
MKVLGQEMFMKRRIFALFIFLAFAAGAAFAHGDKIHVRGRVEQINADSVLVRTPDGKSVEIKLLPATVYNLRSNGEDKPAKFADLVAGDFVVIHARSKDGMLEADEVRFSAPAAARPPASSSPKPNH